MSQLVIMGVIENNHTEVSFHFEMDFSVFEHIFTLNVFKLISYPQCHPIFFVITGNNEV